MTDQGQTGLHDPRGRVLRMTPDSNVSVLLANGPSPNGLVFDHQKPWLYVAMTRGNAIWRVPLFEGEPVKVGIAVQLSGGIGPDGIAMDAQGRLLVAHMQSACGISIAETARWRSMRRLRTATLPTWRCVTSASTSRIRSRAVSSRLPW